MAKDLLDPAVGALAWSTGSRRRAVERLEAAPVPRLTMEYEKQCRHRFRYNHNNTFII
jgi:hypothetical protein